MERKMKLLQHLGMFQVNADSDPMQITLILISSDLQFPGLQLKTRSNLRPCHGFFLEDKCISSTYKKFKKSMARVQIFNIPKQ